MKGSGTLVASVLAASTVAFTTTGDRNVVFNPRSNEGSSSSNLNDEDTASRKSSDKEKFVPRFDGLRFIETLVTAHR